MKYEITKGSEKDFEQAPEWATQLLRDNNDSKKSFVGELGGLTLVAEKMNPHSWWKYNDGYVGTIIAERRPITEPVVNQQLTTEWDGEGLPPVGALCRYRAFSDMPWVECEVLGLQGDDAWLKRTKDGRTFVMGNPELFPIPSPEDVAREKERSEQCDKIFGILSSVERTGNRSDMAEALYDAGYRKME